MMFESNNFGFCQGIVRGAVYKPRDGIVKINLQVKSNRKNPKTNKYTISMLNFLAYGETAEKVEAVCKDGAIVLLNYHLHDHKQTDKRTGVQSVEDEFIIDDVKNVGLISEGKQPYLNKGYLQGFFLGICPMPGSEGIWTLDVMCVNPVTKQRSNHRFFVFGKYAERIAQAFQKGKPAMVEYKIEKSKHVRRDGRTEYFTNCIVEQIT